MLSDEWLPRYRLLENFNKVERERERERDDRGDYNSSFALRAVELKSRFSHNVARSQFRISPGVECCVPEQDTSFSLPSSGSTQENIPT